MCHRATECCLGFTQFDQRLSLVTSVPTDPDVAAAMVICVATPMSLTFLGLDRSAKLDRGTTTVSFAIERISRTWMERFQGRETARRPRNVGCGEHVRGHHLHAAFSARPALLTEESTASTSIADARAVHVGVGGFSSALQKRRSGVVPRWTAQSEQHREGC